MYMFWCTLGSVVHSPDTSCPSFPCTQPLPGQCTAGWTWRAVMHRGCTAIHIPLQESTGSHKIYNLMYLSGGGRGWWRIQLFLCECCRERHLFSQSDDIYVLTVMRIFWIQTQLKQWFGTGNTYVAADTINFKCRNICIPVTKYTDVK